MSICVAACDFCGRLSPIEKTGPCTISFGLPGKRVTVVYTLCRRCYERGFPDEAAAYFASDAHRERKREAAALRGDLQQMIDDAVAAALSVRKARLVEDDAVPLVAADPPTPPPGYRRV